MHLSIERLGGRRHYRCVGGVTGVACRCSAARVSVPGLCEAGSKGSGAGRVRVGGEGSCSVLGFQGAQGLPGDKRAWQPAMAQRLPTTQPPPLSAQTLTLSDNGGGIEREITARRAGQKVVIPAHPVPPQQPTPLLQARKTTNIPPLPSLEVSPAFVRCSDSTPL